MKKEAHVYLDDIIESIDKIEEYITGFTLDQFKNDSGIQDAVIRRLAIIGEAVKNLPPGIKQEYLDSRIYRSFFGARLGNY